MSGTEAMADDSKTLKALKELTTQLDELKKLVPTSSSEIKPAHGIVTYGDNSGYNGVLAAYHAANGIAKEIATTVALVVIETDKIMLIADAKAEIASHIASHGTYRVFLANCSRIAASIDAFNEAFDVLHLKIDIFATGVAAPPQANFFLLDAAAAPIAAANISAIPTLLKIPADVIGLFRLDYTVAGTTVDVATEAVHAAITRDLIVASRTVVSPAPDVPVNSPILTELCDNILAKMLTLKAVPDIPVIGNFDDLPIAKKTEYTALENITVALRKTRDDIIQEVNALVTEAASVPEGGEYALIARLVIHEQMKELKATHFLTVKVLSSGASTITATGPFRSKSPVHSGGVVVDFTLVNAEGTVLAADLLLKTSKGREYLGGTNPIVFESNFRPTCWQTLCTCLCGKKIQLSDEAGTFRESNERSELLPPVVNPLTRRPPLLPVVLSERQPV
jgi:hypothetical protein